VHNDSMSHGAGLLMNEPWQVPRGSNGHLHRPGRGCGSRIVPLCCAFAEGLVQVGREER
jgi:hypothetical protein